MGIFGVGVSALNAAQVGLATAAHNIANVNTPGFNRQEVVMGARLAQSTGEGFVGQGVDAGTVKRIYNEFLSGQVMLEQGQASYLTAYYTQIKQINNMLADSNGGLSFGLQEFFSAVNGVANTPESQPARQTLLGSAQALVANFQSLNRRMTDIGHSVNGQINNSVTTINSYAQQISTLNHNIVLAASAFNGQPPNDLLDQRDQLIAQLNQEIKASVVKQGDGSYNVFIGTGQSLVVGVQAFTLRPIQSLSDPAKLEVAYAGSGGTITRLQQSSFQGGNLGGMMAFRDQSLDVAQNALGRLAIGLAGTFNAQQRLGQDLNGALGGNFFTQPLPIVNNNTENTGNAVIDVSVSSYSALTGSDYSLRFIDAATGYTLTRLSDNTVTTLGSLLPLPQTVDGLTISVTSGPPADGNRYTIRPSVNGARDIALALTDSAKIAAAAPMRTSMALANIGTGKISAGAVNLLQAVSIVFTSATAFTVTGVGVAGSPVTGVPYTSGDNISYNGWTTQISGTPAVGDTFAPMRAGAASTNTGTGTIGAGTVNLGNLQQAVSIVFTSPTEFTVTGVGVVGSPVTVSYTAGKDISYNGWTMQISGAPATGDTFTVGINNNASADNRNALLLAGLQIQNTLADGTASYQGAYGQLVSQVGNKTRELEVTSMAQASMVRQIVQAQQSLSGVNLDEEAADLLRYQRAYQAAGKAMQIADTMFDTLLNLGR